MVVVVMMMGRLDMSSGGGEMKIAEENMEEYSTDLIFNLTIDEDFPYSDRVE